MTELEKIGNKIKEQRKLMNLTQSEFGMQTAQFARYEKGENAMSVLTLIEVCTKLQVSADYLLGLPNTLNGLNKDQEANVLLMKKLNAKNTDRLTGAILQLLSMQEIEDER